VLSFAQNKGREGVGVPGGCSSPAKRPTIASARGLAAAQQSSERERERERGRGGCSDGGKKRTGFLWTLFLFSVSLKFLFFSYFSLSLLIFYSG